MKFTPAALQNKTIFGLPLTVLEKVLDQALSCGGDLAELFFEHTESTRVFYENHKIDKLLEGVDSGCGLRIIFDGRSVYGYTTQLTEAALLQLAQDLSVSVSVQSRHSTEQREWRMSEQKNTDINEYQVKRSARQCDLSTKVDYAKRAHDEAWKRLPTAQQVLAVFLDSERKIAIVNSDGLISEDKKNYLQIFMQMAAQKDGRVETTHTSEGGFVGLEFLDHDKPESLGRETAEKLEILLTALPAPSGTMAVVLSSEAGGTMIHEAVGHGLEADLACQGLSVYQNKIGQQVASPLITVLDDGGMPEKRGSYRFDDEGTPAQKNILIENGILKNYMVDRLSAMKFDLMATGNGRRESFRHQPMVRMTNTYIAPGKDDPAQILKETQKGIYVKSMGGGQVNTVTGDFVFAVTEAYLIHDGKLGEAIRGATLVGNGPQILSIVDRVGNDLGFSTGTCGKDGQAAPVTDAQPTLRIPEITVGGEVPMTEYWK